MNRRHLIKDAFLGAGSLWLGSRFFPVPAFAEAFLLQHGSQDPQSQQHFKDLAEYEEARYPLLAGHFEEALKVLIPQIKERPGVIPYTIASVYLLMEKYADGIPYALQACRDTPTDVRYQWMLRVLTIQANRNESSIPTEFRLKMPASAASSFRLQDVTNESGVGRLALGRGAAWGDFDNDGRDDILVGAERAPFCLLRNLGNGRFEDVAAQMGLVDSAGVGCYASQFIDYDNDGYQDILLASNGWGGSNRLFLFHNDGGKRFTDVTNQAGLGGPVDGFNTSWADYDNDGRADLAVATGIVDPDDGDYLRLYHNEGDGKFREVGREAGLGVKAKWISVCWGDYDGDGYQDLLATSYDAGPFLFRNLGNGHFEDASQRAGIQTKTHAYTAEFFDYNNDGLLDLFVSTYPEGNFTDMISNKMTRSKVPAGQRQLLFRNKGDGTFTNVAEEAGLTGWYGAMSSQVADIDNDGLDEIVLGTGNPELDWSEPKPLFHNDGKGHFEDIADSAGLVHYGMLHGMAFSDYDDSGNLSLFGSFGGFYWGTRETSRLYRNLGSGSHALEIHLVGTRSNRDAIGARVTAVAGARKIYKLVNGGNGFGSLNSRVVHVGLSRDTEVDLLRIDWPSGVHQVFKNVPAGQRIEIVEGRDTARSLVRFSASK